MKHEIMWWMSRLTIMLTSLFLSFSLASSAYAAEIQMGKDGMLVFAPCELNISVGETVTFINNELPPHNMMVEDHPELSHGEKTNIPSLPICISAAYADAANENDRKSEVSMIVNLLIHHIISCFIN